MFTLPDLLLRVALFSAGFQAGRLLYRISASISVIAVPLAAGLLAVLLLEWPCRRILGWRPTLPCCPRMGCRSRRWQPLVNASPGRSVPPSSRGPLRWAARSIRRDRWRCVACGQVLAVDADRALVLDGDDGPIEELALVWPKINGCWIKQCNLVETAVVSNESRNTHTKSPKLSQLGEISHLGSTGRHRLEGKELQGSHQPAERYQSGAQSGGRSTTERSLCGVVPGHLAAPAKTAPAGRGPVRTMSELLLRAVLFWAGCRLSLIVCTRLPDLHNSLLPLIVGLFTVLVFAWPCMRIFGRRPALPCCPKVGCNSRSWELLCLVTPRGELIEPLGGNLLWVDYCNWQTRWRCLKCGQLLFVQADNAVIVDDEHSVVDYLGLAWPKTSGTWVKRCDQLEPELPRSVDR
jgi:hypothetical protein